MAKAEQGILHFDETGQPDRKPLFADLNLDRPLVFFDLETTGLDIHRDRIVQFAFLRIHPDKTRQEWEELVNPGMPIPPGAVRVHNITDAMVQDKPLFGFFAPKIIELLQNCDLAGFNVASFDLPFLAAELERNGFPLDISQFKIADAQVIFHRREPRDLTAAYRFYCNAQHNDAHDAMADVRATAEIFNAQIARYSDLPREMAGLHRYCRSRDKRWVTYDRKIAWQDGVAVINFGKHRNRSLQYIQEKDPDYLRWIRDGDFSDETKAVIIEAMNGRFPVPENEPEEDD